VEALHRIHHEAGVWKHFTGSPPATIEEERGNTDVENTVAWTLMEQLGLRREGHLRQSLRFKGRWADEYLYAMLREDWLQRSGRDAHADGT
jgi:hypothetical protein